LAVTRSIVSCFSSSCSPGWTEDIRSLTVRLKLRNELKSTLTRKLFHTLTTHSLKNVDLTRVEQFSLYSLNLWPLVLWQGAISKKSE